MTDVFEAFDRDRAPDKAPPAEHPLIDRSRWGIFPDVDIEAYHRGSFAGLKPGEFSLSQSGMGRLIAETPLDFAYNDSQINPEGAEERIMKTVAARRGDVVHQLALGKGRGFAIGEFKDWRTKAAGEFKEAAVGKGLIPILKTAFEEAETIAAVVKERIEEVLDGSPYETEVAFLYQEMTEAGPVWIRGLMDVWCEEKLLILDPKVTPRLYDADVGRHMVNMGWDRQAALYSHAVGTILGPKAAGRVRFRDLMVKPEAPFTSRVVRLDKADEYQAIKECRLAIETFGACFYSGNWPGFEEEATVSLPIYVRKAREARETGEA